MKTTKIVLWMLGLTLFSTPFCQADIQGAYSNPVKTKLVLEEPEFIIYEIIGKAETDQYKTHVYLLADGAINHRIYEPTTQKNNSLEEAKKELWLIYHKYYPNIKYITIVWFSDGKYVAIASSSLRYKLVELRIIPHEQSQN